MNKKIIGTIICILLLSTISIQAMELPKEKPSKDQTIEYFDQYLELADENTTLGGKVFLTFGPVNKLITNVEIHNGSQENVEIHNGSQEEIDIIQRNLDRRLFRLSMFLPFLPVLVTNMTLTVSYKIPVGELSRFSYYTLSGDAVYKNNTTELINITNETITLNTVHSVKVENLYGLFIFMKARLFDRSYPIGRKLFHPARFIFFGVCDNVTYLPVPI
jgi:hypothetical protein